jgi:hypothetical protein
MRRKTSAQIRRMEKRAAARGNVYTYNAPPPRPEQNDIQAKDDKLKPKKKTERTRPIKTKEMQLDEVAERLESELKSIDENANLVSKERRSAKRKAEAMAAEDAQMTRADFLEWCGKNHQRMNRCSLVRKQDKVTSISSLLLPVVFLSLLYKSMAWGPTYCHMNRGRQSQHHVSSARSIINGPRSQHHTSISPCPSNPFLSRLTSTTTTSLYGLLDFLSPYESKIPPDLMEEIYQAEANTEAAKDRGTRILVYALMAILGIGLAFFSGFLTELRMNGVPEETEAIALSSSTDSNLDVLIQAGFGWVLANPIYRFLFTNKIGGILCLLLGSGSAILAEAEYDSKRVNAEKIYEELERRRTKKTRPAMRATKKKRQSGREKKNLRALSEVLVKEDKPLAEATGFSANAEYDVEGKENNAANDNPNFFDQMKSFYDKADNMAASQALLLNKKLEEAGVVDKITDETGLKVIGRENAKMLEQNINEKNKTIESE